MEVVQESILPQDGTPYFTCHQTSGPREPSFPCRSGGIFLAETLSSSWAKWGFFRTPTVSQGIFWGKVEKGYFNISEDFFSWGAASLGTCEWIGIGVASYSPTKSSLRIHQSWGYLIHLDDRGASFRVKLFGWPRQVTIMVMSMFYGECCGKKPAMVQLSGADHVFLHRGQTGDLHIILVLSSVEESFSQRLHFSSESSRNHDYP